MIDKVNISIQELNDLRSRGKQVDPSSLNLSEITNSGIHVSEVSDQSVQPKYNLGKLSHSGRHVYDITEEVC